MTNVLTSAKLDSTGHRWLSVLAAYDFDLTYRPGRTNADADALSRLPVPSHNVTLISKDSIKAIFGAIYKPYVDTLAMDVSIIDMHIVICSYIDWPNNEQTSSFTLGLK